MENLRDLKELAKQVVQNFNEKFDASDRVIPKEFKEKVTRLKSFSVVYNEYSVIIKGDGIRSKDSYVPNQSFYMASFFIEYSYELSRYKQKIMPWISSAGISTSEMTAFFTHERDRGKEDVKNKEDKFVEILDKNGYTGDDREYLIKFVTDYEWWSGSKTIERSDFFNSPVLSIMGLTASSNAAMALIVDHLTQHPELSSLLLNQVKDKNMENFGNLQQIFYGAPGTGKSHEIKKQTKGQSVIRTTFHPDSDYSTFVGAYKPFMDSVSARVVPVVIDNGISLNQNVGTYNEKRITYKFVKQAFLKAYLGAWKKYSEGKNCPVSIKVKGKIEFDTNSGHYILLSVSDNNILYSREFDFDKATVEKVWSTLWNNDLFSIPTGPQSGQSVEQAIASWIKNNYESCTKADFENGWNFLIQKINEDSSIVVKKDNGDGNSTREYILKSHHENTKVRVKVREAGKSKYAIEKCFDGDNKRENQLEAKIVELLNKYEGSFEEKWNQLKSDVNDGSEVREELTYRTQYLIIEEINRGNCAQIFGDLFQLLDRSANGFSEYPIEADTDMQNAIKNAFAEEDEYKVYSLNIDDVIDGYISNYDSTLSNDVREGRVLLLPPNLYIWATMNTSDQSLFPIDSAFKRRWDWIYRPIGYKNSHWTIEIGEKRYNWVDFQKRINQKIYDVDNSEDKQLGDYFVNADRTGDTINADTLLNKILFYLWNDVCKDDPDQIFRWIDDKKQTESIKFSDFFGADREKKLQGFMTFNEIKAVGEPQNADTNMIQQDEEEAVTSDTPTEEDNDLNE